MTGSSGTSISVVQSPAPGTATVFYLGDCVRFFLRLSAAGGGRAYVRTNLGKADVARNEIINRVEKNEIKLGEAWCDLPMSPVEDNTFAICLPLIETGHFQAKCFFMPDNSDSPVWPQGGNAVINVEPAGTCCANIIYNAFVRQFGRTRSAHKTDPSIREVVRSLDDQGYTIIPPSGKFRDLKDQVHFIFARMGCRVLHLLPIHPTPTTYARMGRFGSPYAALDFTGVDPALAVFDPSATPLEQFMELADTVHGYSGYLILDIAINHTGWAASIHESNPEWLDREDSGRIKAPGAWGVVWADLTKLDYRHTDLWQYMADIFLLWCHRGADGFRCDAGYMIPLKAWEYIIAKVRHEYPDTLFLLEGLGGPVPTTEDLLSRANFNWAYSEMFQQYTLEDISRYLPFAAEISEKFGHLINYAETHDNDRLAKTSHAYARMRTALCALFSVCGGFGFANGVEWFATEKINVHEAACLNWDSPVNQVDFITRLIVILREHPAFFAGAHLKLIQIKTSAALVLRRYSPGKQSRVLVLVNLNCSEKAVARWPNDKDEDTGTPWLDLITGELVWVTTRDDIHTLELGPGQVLALTLHAAELNMLSKSADKLASAPGQVVLQKKKALVLSMITAVKGYADLGSLDVEAAVSALDKNPLSFFNALNPASRERRIVVFDIHRDLNRWVMVPPGFILAVKGADHFRAELSDTGPGKSTLEFKESLSLEAGSAYWAFFMPRSVKGIHQDCLIKLRIFNPEKNRVETGHIRYLAPFETLALRQTFSRHEVFRDPTLKQTASTKRGGMMRAAADFGRLESRYDALLGANLNPDLPEDRWMLLSRYRIWAVFQGYSRELCLDCLQNFRLSYDRSCRWQFQIPTSEGRFYLLNLTMQIDPEQNRVVLSIYRPSQSQDHSRRLEDHREVNIIVRADIEDRSFHQTVKAFTGPESIWPTRVIPFEKGFFFTSERSCVLRVAANVSGFVHMPEWQYMVERPLETTRGLDDKSDLFSPGYFDLSLNGGQTLHLEACVTHDQTLPEPGWEKKIRIVPLSETTIPFSEALVRALDLFVVNRDNQKTVIAGFPWFLDWGRDTLIFCRCLISLGRTKEAIEMVKLFGRFASGGTVPNMICGKDAGNIETSDAPLWFFACCRQLAEQHPGTAVLEKDADGRTIRQVLIGMAEAMIRGTPTGVKADPDTCLLYSPAHFTWMDTNFPAGTPRQGYPVEIQALWWHALTFLSRIDVQGKKDTWTRRADRVRHGIMDLFWLEGKGYFSDCLHCRHPASAAAATADDALRPNQLLLITLGVVNDPEIMKTTIETCMELLIPGGIRSLANRPVTQPLHIVHHGKNLNDPYAPYAGKYQGDEDTQRKPAYHNGTAWTWQMPLFCEAWARVFGKLGVDAALAWLGSAAGLLRTGSAGYVPEILDGDYPHTPRGCDAQAWGVSELARVAHELTRMKKEGI